MSYSDACGLLLQRLWLSKEVKTDLPTIPVAEALQANIDLGSTLAVWGLESEYGGTGRREATNSNHCSASL